MNMDELQNAIEMLDDELITETGNVRRGEKKTSKFNVFTKYASVAACFCILVVGSLIAFSVMNNHKSAPDKDDIPTDAVLNEEFGTSSLDSVNPEEDEEQKNENSTDNETAETHDRINNNAPTEESKNQGTSKGPTEEVSPEADPPEDEGEKGETPSKNTTVNLSAGINSDGFKYEGYGSHINYTIPFSDYAMNLFREVYTGNGNEMISPLSVSYALGMAANGASGETLKQIEELLGMTKDEFNVFLKSYMNSLPNGDGFKFSAANSVWLRNSFEKSVSNNYLTDLMKYYNVEVYSSPFNKNTVDDINSWVSGKTDGMIDRVLNDLSTSEMILINALCFDAEWEQKFDDFRTKEQLFTTASGEGKYTDFMRDSLSSYYNSRNYIEDETCKGIIKYYKGKKYAFVALLPNEDLTLDNFVSNLTGEKLNSLISNSSCEDVVISLPRFEVNYEGDLKDQLMSLGMTDAFISSVADFSGISKTSPLYISGVIHKTYIKVDEDGTKASAVTAIPVPGDSGSKDMKFVYFNRPFVYVVIDCENSVPMFVGTFTDPPK